MPFPTPEAFCVSDQKANETTHFFLDAHTERVFFSPRCCWPTCRRLLNVLPSFSSLRLFDEGLCYHVMAVSRRFKVCVMNTIV